MPPEEVRRRLLRVVDRYVNHVSSKGTEAVDDLDLLEDVYDFVLEQAEQDLQRPDR